MSYNRIRLQPIPPPPVYTRCHIGSLLYLNMPITSRLALIRQLYHSHPLSSCSLYPYLSRMFHPIILIISSNHHYPSHHLILPTLSLSLPLSLSLSLSLSLPLSLSLSPTPHLSLSLSLSLRSFILTSLYQSYHIYSLYVLYNDYVDLCINLHGFELQTQILTGVDSHGYESETGSGTGSETGSCGNEEKNMKKNEKHQRRG